MDSFPNMPITDDLLAICIRRAIRCIGREYPNHPQTLLAEPADLQTPRVQTPAFFGCFDWHSAVHAHWLLVRMLRVRPEADWATDARAILSESLTEDNLQAERRHILKSGREGFERPYGLAWLLQLHAELQNWNDPIARPMALSLASLAIICWDRLGEWLVKLSHPIRTGEHSQTAFAMGLAHDWAGPHPHGIFKQTLDDRAWTFFSNDRDLPVHFEPSGHDFLSPALAEADLMRRVLPNSEFSTWLAEALPIRSLEGIKPVIPPDRTDGKLAHLDGLNLSRAWMLSAIAESLDPTTEHASLCERLAQEHRAAGAAAISSEHYAGTHWLGTFYVYDATRGIDSSHPAAAGRRRRLDAAR